MRRRQYLAATAVLCSGLAGCNGDAGSSDETTHGTVTETPTETETLTPTATETLTPTATDTSTPTVVPPGRPSHATGERFVVGEGSTAFAYTVHQFLRADRLGFGDGRAANGVFVVVDMTAEKLSGRDAAVPVESIILRGGVVKRSSTDLSSAAANDGRIDVPSLADTNAFPGNPVRGVLAYDVPREPSDRLYLRITPPDDTSDEAAHAVPVGPLDEIPPLE